MEIRICQEIVTLRYTIKSEKNYFAKCLFALLADNRDCHLLPCVVITWWVLEISGKYIERLFLSIFYQTEAESRERDFCDSGVAHVAVAEHFFIWTFVSTECGFLQENKKKLKKKAFTSCRTHSVHDKLATHQEQKKKNTYQKCTRFNNKVYCIQIIIISNSVFCFFRLGNVVSWAAAACRWGWGCRSGCEDTLLQPNNGNESWMWGRPRQHNSAVHSWKHNVCRDSCVSRKPPHPSLSLSPEEQWQVT